MAGKTATATLPTSSPVNWVSESNASGFDKVASSIISTLEIQGSLKPPNGDSFYIFYTHPNIQPVSMTQHGQTAHCVENGKYGKLNPHWDDNCPYVDEMNSIASANEQVIVSWKAQQPADRLLGEPEEQKAKSQKTTAGDEKKKEKKKTKNTKKHQRVPRTSMTTSGATIGMMYGGTVHANVTTTGGNSYIQHGNKAQQKYYYIGEKSDSESEDDGSSTDDSQ